MRIASGDSMRCGMPPEAIAAWHGPTDDERDLRCWILCYAILASRNAERGAIPCAVGFHTAARSTVSHRGCSPSATVELRLAFVDKRLGC